jgi:3',5'-cyclic AMP phosphodiesterase CpdA
MTDHSSPLFSFGVIADPQYADIPPKPEAGRYYANSPAKLAAAVEVFNTHDLAFVVTLGDLIDRGFENFDGILPAYDALRHRSILLPGNHDFAVEPDYLTQVHQRLGMPAPWYDFAIGTHRFVVLDGNDVSLFAPPLDDPRREIAAERLAALQAEGAINAQTWNGSFSDVQFEWLKATLQKADGAGETVMLFCHYPLYPENAHNMWDAPRIIDLLSEHVCAAAWFNGHNHDGNFGTLSGTHFVNFKGMVDTPDENTFAIVDVYDDRIEIRGFGREDSRILMLSAQFAAGARVAS